MDRITKKRFKTVGVLELRTRIYDSKMIKAISDLWINRASMYRNCKNDFINDLISRGIEALMLEEENEMQATRVDTILNRLDKIEVLTGDNANFVREVMQALYLQNKANYELLTKINDSVGKPSYSESFNINKGGGSALDYLRENKNLISNLDKEFNW